MLRSCPFTFLAGSSSARCISPRLFGKYVPPTTNLLPTMDNGAHFDLAFQLQAVEEVSTLFKRADRAGPLGACLLP